MTSPNILQGRLSLGSFIKLSVIAAIGSLPVVAIVYGLAVCIGLARGHHSASPGDMPDDVLILALWPLFLLKAISTAAGIVLSGFFAGLCGYPFYAWVCRRGCGVVLKGKFEVIL